MFQGIEYVLAVYESQSFSKAAKKLFISQPSLSANIKRIESRLGMEIFDRSTIPLKLTEFGQEYIQRAQEIWQIEQDFINYMSDYSDLETGRLVLGGSSLYASLMLPHLMANFHRNYPNLELSIVEETTLNLENLLHEGRIDILLDNTTLDEELFDKQVYLRESLLLAVPKAFKVNQSLEKYQITSAQVKQGVEKWGQVPFVPFEVFDKQAFVLLKEDNDTGERARKLCQDSGVEPDIQFNVEQQLTAYNITASGMAISIVGDGLVTKVTNNEEITYYRLKGEEAQREIAFFWRKERYKSKAMIAFLELSMESCIPGFH